MWNKKRTIGPDILNLSRLIWTEEAGADRKKYSAFLAADFEHWNSDAPLGHFWVCCGDIRVEDGVTGVQNYLAVVRREGGYTIESLDRYMEIHGREWIVDLRRLPDEMNGMKFNKAPADTQRLEAGQMFIRWRRGTFCARSRKRDVWDLREGEADG